MENGPFIDDLAIKRLIFHSYVSLPEGRQVGNLERKYHRTTTFGISPGISKYCWHRHVGFSYNVGPSKRYVCWFITLSNYTYNML